MTNHLTKTINGKVFKFVSREFNQEFASKKSKEIKKQGNYTRIIDNCVYACAK